MSKRYVNLKVVIAFPIDKDNQPGYSVVFADGHQIWLPKETFEMTFRPVNGRTFGMALEAVKRGRKVARHGWNGQGMFLFLVPGSKFKVNRAPLLGIYPEGTEVNYHAHIDMRAADGQIVPWLASQTDVLADDWYEVE